MKILEQAVATLEVRLARLVAHRYARPRGGTALLGFSQNLA